MKTNSIRAFASAAAIAVCTLAAVPVLAQDDPVPPRPNLEDEFLNPPDSARPRVWWHWMNGNVTEDGIAKDLAWMKRIGIGGVQNFDVDLITPQIVEKRLIYITPEWRKAFRFATSEADRHGLEFTIAASPGWSETGGPWVKPKDGLKKLVWSATDLAGGQRLAGKLAGPPTVTGPFQMIPKTPVNTSASPASEARETPRFYEDVAVLAFPRAKRQSPQAPVITSSDGTSVDASLLSDADPLSAVHLPPPEASAPASLTFSYPAPQTIRSASLFIPGAATLFFGTSVKAQLETSPDRTSWHKITDIKVTQVPTTVSFAPTTAKLFRVVFLPAEAQSPSGPVPKALTCRASRRSWAPRVRRQLPTQAA